MHILIFLDQHIDSLGGVQASVRLQKKYLEKQGHVVTVCAPMSRHATSDEAYIVTPSFPITPDKEYSITLPSRRVVRFIDNALASRPPVDIVHVQADYWGAILGIGFAKRRNLPCLITFHNNVEVGLRKTTGRAIGALFIRLMSLAATRHIPGFTVAHPWRAWSYIDSLAALTDVRTTPTAHFARYLAQHGVTGDVVVVSNGIDDEILAKTVATEPDEFTVVWAGRMSSEKRPLEYLRAIREANLPVHYALYGTGPLRAALERYVRRHGMTNVSINKRLSYADMLSTIASASLFVQTSIGFETQGMTVFESVLLGTPIVLSDPEIAEDFPEEAYWLAPTSEVSALAQTMVDAHRALTAHKPTFIRLGEKYDYRQSTLTNKMVRLYREAAGRYDSQAKNGIM